MRQLTKPSQHIFITIVTDSDGQKTQLISAQSLNDQSICMNHTWDGEKWEGKQYVKGKCTNRGALFLLMNTIFVTSSDQYNISFNKKQLPHFVYINMLAFIFGEVAVGCIGKYAVAIERLVSFREISMDPFILVDAVMRGQEDMVINILEADSSAVPNTDFRGFFSRESRNDTVSKKFSAGSTADSSYLLKKAKVKNSVGVEHDVTPLQAAIIANDVQMVEMMKFYFERLTTDSDGNPIDGLAKMAQQIKEIYTESLQRYLSSQEAKIRALEKTQQTHNSSSNLTMIYEQRQYDSCQEAIKSGNIKQIIDAHNLAQKKNAFYFKPYVDAVLNASQVELDDVMTLINAKTSEETATVIAHTGVGRKESDECRGKPLNELTLVQKLNRFREKLVEHMQYEIIFNPQHILAGLEQNEKTWVNVKAGSVVDPTYKKRIVIFCQLVGKAQRKAPEAVLQDIRQGVSYLTGRNEPRTRQSRFNKPDDQNHPDIRNFLIDISLNNPCSIDGIGYKLAANVSIADILGRGGCAQVFSTYFEQKKSTLEKLIRHTPTAQSKRL